MHYRVMALGLNVAPNSRDKAIFDAYMCSCGLAAAVEDSVVDVVHAAIESTAGGQP